MEINKQLYVAVSKLKKTSCGCDHVMQGLVTDKLTEAQKTLKEHRDIFVLNRLRYKSIYQEIEVYNGQGDMIAILTDVGGE